ncbi:MAG: histidine phosphatase family protein [Chlorobi bacterium]|nr:histidine phosphatase family protein [Chlorobiota bacterium]
MKRLILIRHAKAVSSDEENASDFERELTQRGCRDAERMGQWLRAIVSSIDCMVASPSRRTRQTAEIIAKAWGDASLPIEYDQALYLPSLDTVRAVVWALDPAWRTVALVGHNPSLSDVLVDLTGEPYAPLPTCAIAVLNVHAMQWHSLRRACARVEHYATPKEINM